MEDTVRRRPARCGAQSLMDHGGRCRDASSRRDAQFSGHCPMGTTHQTSAVAEMLRMSILTLQPADSASRASAGSCPGIALIPASACFCCHAVEAPGRGTPPWPYPYLLSQTVPWGRSCTVPRPLSTGDGDGHGSWGQRSFPPPR